MTSHKASIYNEVYNMDDRLRVTDIHIIVTGTKEKPYFQIKYKEVGKKEYKIGYGSYQLDLVFDWKNELFKIV
ncbi:MAG: hypothetical protein ACI3T9_01970 [Romboutsia timonensis]